MAKFNTATKKINVTTNYEGAEAYKLSPELELYSAVCTTILNNNFYEKDEDRLNRLVKLIKQCSPDFVAKLAIYAREKMYLRSVPVLLAIELAKIHKGDSLVSKMVNRIVQRPDEITELLACYQKGRKDTKKLNKLNKQIQKGIRTIFESGKFDEYQYAKWGGRI